MEFALTITIQPIHYKDAIEKQYDDLLQELLDDILDDDTKVSLVIELTSNHNIHAHGVLKLFTKGKARSFLSSAYNVFRHKKVIGFVKIKDMGDAQGWLDYTTKNLKETADHVDRPVVLIDQLGLYEQHDKRSILSTCPCL